MYLKTIGTDNAVKLPLNQDAWLLFRFDHHEIIRLDLSPGEAIENHAIDWRIVFYILRGEGTLHVEGSQYKLTVNESIAVQPGKERFWHNTGKDTLELLVIKTEENR